MSPHVVNRRYNKIQSVLWQEGGVQLNLTWLEFTTCGCVYKNESPRKNYWRGGSVLMLPQHMAFLSYSQENSLLLRGGPESITFYKEWIQFKNNGNKVHLISSIQHLRTFQLYYKGWKHWCLFSFPFLARSAAKLWIFAYYSGKKSDFPNANMLPDANQNLLSQWISRQSLKLKACFHIDLFILTAFMMPQKLPVKYLFSS